MNYYLAVLKKYAVFEGRAGRAEFWYFVLINMAVSMVLSYINRLINSGDALSIGYIGFLYSLAVLIPSLAVGVRRLHDIGKSGAWLFIILIPIVGWIWLIVLNAKEGDAGNNEYGAVPQAISSDPGAPTTPQEPPQPTN